MAVIEKSAILTTKDQQGNTVVYKPFTDIEMVDGAIKTVNNLQPDANGNITLPSVQLIIH